MNVVEGDGSATYSNNAFHNLLLGNSTLVTDDSNGSNNTNSNNNDFSNKSNNINRISMNFNDLSYPKGSSLANSDDEITNQNINERQRCLLQEHLESISLENNNDDYCLTHFDTILCWPRTPRGSLAVLPCLNEFQGIRYDVTQNATRFCDLNGTWDKYTNYDSCLHLPAPTVLSEFEPIVELPTIIYYVGYTISLISLTLALIVFIYFKELRCLRNSIHANLFFTYVMSALFWILTLNTQIYSGTGSWSACFILVTVFHFFTLTNFFWMLVEGLYLYMLVVKTFSGDNIRFRIYATIGWGGPAVCVIIWTIARARVISNGYKLLDLGCPWIHETTVDWIFQGPICIVLLINLIFLLRIMWVLITKLRSANSIETRQYRKASKALLVLIPLFGITYLIVLAGPNENDVMGHTFAMVRAALLSTQGFSVSLFYCFLNSEVRSALRHHISRWRDARNVRLSQSKRHTKSSLSNNNSFRLESTRPSAGYFGKGKRESCISSTTTTTTFVSQNPVMALQRTSNGTLQLLPNVTTTTTTLTVMPNAISPLMKQELQENSV